MVRLYVGMGQIRLKVYVFHSASEDPVNIDNNLISAGNGGWRPNRCSSTTGRWGIYPRLLAVDCEEGFEEWCLMQDFFLKSRDLGSWR